MRREAETTGDGGGEETTNRSPRPAGFLTVLEAQVAAVVVAALLGMAAVRHGGAPAAAPAEQRDWWPRKAAVLEQRLRNHPEDDAVRLQLANLRIGQALTSAQRAFNGDRADYDVDNVLYRRHVAASLRASPEVAWAEATLRSLAHSGPDRPSRARAWCSLSLFYSLTGDESQQHDCLAAAYHEQPLSQYRSALAVLRLRVPSRDGALE